MAKSTRQKLCEAAIELFSKDGYDAVSTKKIAEVAGVSEMTLFRHFGTKSKLYEDAYDTYVYQPNFETLFERGLKGDVEIDLLRIGHVYLDALYMNKSLILMEIRSKSGESSDRPLLTKAPVRLKNAIIAYLDDLKNEGIIKNDDTEMIAVSFISSILGHFFREVITHQSITEITAVDGIDYSIRKFVNSILSNAESE